MDYKIIGYDFEVFSKANWWMVVFIDYESKERTVILNNKKELEEFYKIHKNDIFVGYNSRGYDQWILKGILLGQNPCKINDDIIIKGKHGGQILRNHKNIKLNNFDVSNPMNSLKQLEGFMGSMIKESSIPFDLNRPLTNDEIQETIFYCTHDVEETLKVFEYKRQDFDSQLLLIETFNYDMENFNKTKVQLSSNILGAVSQHTIDDEFDITFLDNLKLDKYKYVLDWYKNPRNLTYGTKEKKQQLETIIAGVPHTFAWGGVHGALNNYSAEGIIVCCDVASLYPSIMINYGFLSRNVIEPKRFTEIRDTRIKLKKAKDKKQGALKIVINGTYGASKDRNNPLFDPRMANNVCVTGQLFLLDLIEKIEPYGKLIQSNTDGIYMLVDNEKTVETIKDVAKEWENRTGLILEWDIYSKIYQRDVNNYILVDKDGHYKSKGCVKKKTPIDNDLPIVSEAVINYCVNNIPIEETINTCDELIKFQKVVKVSKLYKYATYGDTKLSEKVLRVFASNEKNAQGVFKIKDVNKIEKIANTPDKCFIYNDSVIGVSCPERLDKQYYIDLAKDMVKHFIGDGIVKNIKITNEEQIINILNKNYSTFYEVLENVKLNTSVQNKKLISFIMIDVFKKYGKAKKLLKYNDIFKTLYNKKSINGKTLAKTINDENVINILKSFSNYNENKNTYSKIESKSALLQIFEEITNEDINIYEKLYEEFKLYNDLTIHNDDLDSQLIYIMNVNDTKNPSIIAYSLKTGITNILKVPKDTFNILEIKQHDLIKIKSLESKPKIKVIGKNEEGINIIGEDKDSKNVDWWLTQYEVLIRDYKNNKMLIDEERECL